MCNFAAVKCPFEGLCWYVNKNTNNSNYKRI